MATRIDLICTAADQSACDDWLTQLLGSDQSGSLSVPLSESGDYPASHFGASGVFEDELVTDILEEELWVSFVDDGSGLPADVFNAFVESQGLHWIQVVD